MKTVIADYKKINRVWENYFTIEDVSGCIQSGGFHVIKRIEDSKMPVQILNLQENDTGMACLNVKQFEEYQHFLSESNKEASKNTLYEYCKKIDYRFNLEDLIFYADSKILKKPETPSEIVVKKLTEADKKAFDEMVAECSEKELDDSYVSITDDVVYGAYLSDKMVVQASAYAFLEDENFIFDIGYITHPGYRKNGYAAAVAYALCEELIEMEKIPQIRVQPVLAGSVALAKKLGFNQYGYWEYEFIDD